MTPAKRTEAQPRPAPLTSMVEGQPLALLYAVTPAPNVIRVSTNKVPSHVDLTITVSPPFSTVRVKSIEITIPVGGNDPAQLSAAKDLPEPEYDHSGPWKISTSGSRLKIEPASGPEGVVTNAITCRLPKINVNEELGNVAVAAIEFPTSGTKRSGEIAELTKQKSDTPVLDFHVEPAVVTRLDTRVKFHWTCADPDGKNLFRVTTSDDSWDTGDCRNVEDACLDCASGAQGVDGPRIEKTDPPTFVLQVLRVQDGDRVVTHTIERSVKVRVPQFQPGSHSVSYLSGRIQRLYWKAINASRCSVQVDNLPVVDDNAPIDTYDDGYLVYIPTSTGKHHVTVTAHAIVGTAVDTQGFDVDVEKAIARVSTDATNPYAAAFTPDNAYVLAGYVQDRTIDRYGVRVIDPARASVVQTLMTSTSVRSMVVANIRGDPVALTVGLMQRQVHVIKLASFPFVVDAAHKIELADFGGGDISVSADGRLALATLRLSWLQVIGVVARTAGAKIQWTPAERMSTSGSALTPDGTHALTITSTGRQLNITSLATQTRVTVGLQPVVPQGSKAEPVEHRHMKHGMAIQVTADGALALIAVPAANRVVVVNLETLTLEPAAIPTGTRPLDVALSPDGQFALVANFGDRTVGIIDVPNRRLAKATIPCDGSPTTVALSADGTRAVILNDEGSVIVI